MLFRILFPQYYVNRKNKWVDNSAGCIESYSLRISVKLHHTYRGLHKTITYAHRLIYTPVKSGLNYTAYDGRDK